MPSRSFTLDGLLAVRDFCCVTTPCAFLVSGVVDDPVSTLDVPGTILDYAGVAPSTNMHSRSLRPLIDGTGAPRRHNRYIE